jgi:hypothetical protein
MALSVECIGRTNVGLVFSVAHYREQNGDLCCDPDVTILRGSDGEWYPLTFEQAGIAYRPTAEVGAEGIVRVNSREQADLVQFVNLWMTNIQAQQRLELP